MSPLKHAKTCVRCGGQNWLPFKHWRICLDCQPEYLVYAVAPAPPKPELHDKGIPKRRPM